MAKTVKAKAATRSRKEAASRARSDGLPSVRVRMYRQGLGDCFLLTFNAGPDEKHILIDCGTLGSTTTNVTIEQVMRDIASTTDETKGKGNLEVLVATHAHKDHVSGFLSQQEILSGFEIKNVWMGWTEDPTDPLAKKFGAKLASLRAAVGAAYAMTGASTGLKDKLAGIAEFEDGQVNGGVLAMGDSIAKSLDIIRKHPGAAVTYQSPGHPPIELPAIPGFRFYFLGPPRNLERLKNEGRHGSDELYGLLGAIHARSGDEQLPIAADAPFDARFCYPIAESARLFPEYGDADQKGRRIDDQWMRGTVELAAVLDDYRNNTSLAIAIERIADGSVLLFPADAQEGNWLSWHATAMQWKVKNPKGETRVVTTEDLLSRTVFYKVGHHSSHNATARGKGLEIMRKNKQLTAFIPVDRQLALRKPPAGSWRMPAAPLYRELLEACDGRVVRADLGWAEDAKLAKLPAVEKEFQGLATDGEWDRWRATQAAATNVDIRNLYVDYRL